MDYFRAFLCLGLFGFLGYAVIFDILPAQGGSSKTRAVKSMLNNATDQYGVLPIGLGLIALGVALALFFVLRQRRRASYQ